jgi:hypothetical protein
MAGGTHVFDMIKRIRENENLRKRSYFKKIRNRYIRQYDSLKISYKDATPIERLEIRRNVMAERKRDMLKFLIGFIFLILAVLTFLAVMMGRF